jgi:CHAT domain-containing protein/TolA-binding protein
MMTRRCARLVVVCILLALAGPGNLFAQSEELAALNRQVEELLQTGRYAEAVEPAKRALALTESQRGSDDIETANALNRLAVAYLQQGGYALAEPNFRRALVIKERVLGPTHSEVGTALFGLAVLYVQQGRYAEAEPIYKRTLDIKEKSLGPEHSEVGSALFGLAALYVNLGRYADAEPLYRRVITIKEKALGANHSEVGSSLHNLAVLLAMQGRNQEAEALYERTIAIKEQALGPDHTEVGSALYGLAELYAAQGRYQEAEPIYRRILAIKEKALGAEHTEIATTLFGLANLYAAQGRYADAEPLYQRVLELKLKALGPDHPEVGTALAELAAIRFNQSQWSAAADYWQRSVQVIINRARRGIVAGGQNQTGRATSEAQRERARFEGLLKASHRAGLLDMPHASDIAQDMFTMAQWSQSSQAAASLELMAARQVKGGGALATLIRERQDLVEDWQAKDKLLIAARVEPADRRNQQAESALSGSLSQIDGRLAEIDKVLAKEFPEYAAATDPEPLTLADARALLRKDEALLLFFDTPAWQPAPEETFIWVVTRTEARWLRSDFGTQALGTQVVALRCGLDQTAWDGEGQSRCGDLLHNHTRAETLPFDLKRAYDLYRALFGQAEDLIKDKHLLIVPSGHLTALPFQVLVTTAPKAAIPDSMSGYRGAAWLARQHALTVLPSVASLKALRRFARTSQAKEPFIGFGNPLLLGPYGTNRSAWETQTCSRRATGTPRIAARGIRAPITSFFRGNLADVELIRSQQPLPETSDELCAVARSVGASERAVYLGEKATETALKALSKSGTLAGARILHFATHGLLAGETNMMTASRQAEPALILTPPREPTEQDDGLLTASEVTQLRLDADWVVLSACNTAAGSNAKTGAADSTEALSGLARAFFYAGARALLVSHWAVDSRATVSLVTKAFSEIRADAKVGRSEALRRSMLALIESGGRNAHPTSWAPFVVVGEGAR